MRSGPEEQGRAAGQQGKAMQLADSLVGAASVPPLALGSLGGERSRHAGRDSTRERAGQPRRWEECSYHSSVCRIGSASEQL